MTVKKTDNKKKLTKKESASREFSKVADATTTFLKAIFPHGYAFIAKLGGKPKNDNAPSKK